MENAPIAVESVRNLEASGKRLLEEILGRPLQEDQQIFIMVLSPGKEPAEESRRQARAGLQAMFAKTADYAREHGISNAEIDAAIEDAMDRIRHQKE